MPPVELHGEACRRYGNSIRIHEERLVELEARRREVKRDHDVLQAARLIEADVIEV